MRAVFQRELEAYFSTIIGYVFLAFFLFICGYGFVFGSVASGTASMFSVITNIVNVLYLLIPILTMRIFSEELRAKTDQLLFTSPVPIAKIVLGKFFAAEAVIVIASMLSLLFPIIMFIFGNPYLGEVLLAYAGLWLLSSSLTALGLFISTLTEHQFVASMITFLCVLLLMSVGAALPLIGSQWLAGAASWFDLFSKFQYFASGILGFDAILYYLSFTAVFLLLATVSLNRRLTRA